MDDDSQMSATLVTRPENNMWPLLKAHPTPTRIKWDLRIRILDVTDAQTTAWRRTDQKEIWEVWADIGATFCTLYLLPAPFFAAWVEFFAKQKLYFEAIIFVHISIEGCFACGFVVRSDSTLKFKHSRFFKMWKHCCEKQIFFSLFLVRFR